MKSTRMKAKSGISVQWRYEQRKSDGKWKVFSVGSPKIRKQPMPTAFLPFEITNAVMSGQLFDTEDALINFLRSI